MILLLIFSFLGGLVTVLSPCILPILPIVLSSSLTGDKKRPIGVVIGFILSFTFFTLFLSFIVSKTGISADALRSFSVFVILLFGVSLLLPKFQQLLEQAFSNLSRFTPHSEGKTGFWGGVLIGTSIGLIWTPCVGPILASIISLAISGSVSGAAALITFSYSLGTAIPMFAIVYGGRNLLNRLPWLTKNTGKIQKVFGVLMVLTAIAIYFNYDRKFQTYILDKFPNYGIGLTAIEDNDLVRRALEKLGESQLDSADTSNGTRGKPMFDIVTDYGLAPELVSGGEWLNSEPLKLSNLRGKVVLIDFWTYTCINCIRTLPYLTSWDAKYGDKGLVIIGVHTPEFEFEKSVKNVREAIADFSINYPVMQDNNYSTWKAYNNRYWPAKYLIDKNGAIRYTHFGEGEYDETEKVIQELLSETGVDVNETINNPDYKVQARTPELYLGYWRMDYYANPKEIRKNIETDYTYPKELNTNTFSFSGVWTVNEKFSKPTTGSSLSLKFNAKDVFLVMRPKEETSKAKIEVYLDGEKVSEGAGEDIINSIVEVDKNRLYKLINLEKPGIHTLELKFLDSNAEVYAFTFG